MPKKQVCDSCRTKKIFCDAALPKCEWCSHRQIACTYDGKVATNGTNVPEILSQDELELRVRRLEQVLKSKLSETEQSADFEGSAVAPSRLSRVPSGFEDCKAKPAINDVFFGSFCFAGTDLGDVGSRNGIPVFSKKCREWIEHQTGQTDGFAHTYSEMMAKRTVSFSNTPRLGLARKRFRLPPRELVEEYLEIYADSPLRPVFPVINFTRFKATMERAYNTLSDQSSREVMSSKICVLAFVCALSLLEPIKIAFLEPIDAETCANEAERCLLSMLAQVNVETLEAAILLCTYRDLRGQIQAAMMLHSLASRSIFSFGGHLNQQSQDQNPTRSELRHHIRSLFWICYFFDKHISLRTGQPQWINDDHCDLTLPENGTVFSSTEKVPAWSNTHFVYPSDLRLTIIKSKIFTTLYSVKAFRKSDTQLLCDIRELDEELESWRLALPDVLRPNLSSSVVDTEAIKRHERPMLVIFVHFEYLFLLATIHQACGRCESQAAKEFRASGAFKSSLALSIEASRSLLCLLMRTFNAVHRESFWLITFYPIWAMMTIFFNILLYPQAETATDDVELLRLIPNIMKNMRDRELTYGELAHLRTLAAFVAELVRLANHAIDRFPCQNAWASVE